MSESANVRLTERAYEALLKDDMNAFLALCADEIELVYPGEGAIRYGGRFHGRDEIRRWADLHNGVEEILDVGVQHTLPSEEHVVVIGQFQGRALDTGRRWETPFVHVLTFGDGQLVQFQAFFDTAAAVEAHRPSG